MAGKKASSPQPKIPASQRNKYQPTWEEAAAPFATGEDFNTVYQPTCANNLVAKGTYGTIWAYWYVPKSEERAIKLINNTPQNRKLAANELTVMRRIGNHPNLMKVHGVFSGPQCMVIVMDLAHGNLADQVIKVHAGGEIVSPATLDDLASELLSALAYMHNNGVAHRDLKVENILCKNSDSLTPIILADYDTSFTTAPGHDIVMDSPCGTLHSMAPEVIRRKMDFLLLERDEVEVPEDTLAYKEPKQEDFTFDAKIDVYGFGVCMFFIVTAERPFNSLGCSKHIHAQNFKCFDCLDRRLKDQTLEGYRESHQRMFRNYARYVRQMIVDALTFKAEQRPTAQELINQYLAGTPAATQQHCSSNKDSCGKQKDCRFD